jgi:hypothetical protein
MEVEFGGPLFEVSNFSFKGFGFSEMNLDHGLLIEILFPRHGCL